MLRLSGLSLHLSSQACLRVTLATFVCMADTEMYLYILIPTVTESTHHFGYDPTPLRKAPRSFKDFTVASGSFTKRQAVFSSKSRGASSTGFARRRDRSPEVLSPSLTAAPDEDAVGSSSGLPLLTGLEYLIP